MDGAQLLKTWIDREPSTQVTFPLSCGRMRGAQSYGRPNKTKNSLIL